MKKRLLAMSAFAALFLLPTLAQPQDVKTIKLNEPNKKRGLPFMETLSVKASATEWADTELSLQDLSDLLWAANGINRPESGKRTASSAMNAQDVDIYVFMKDGVYLYDARGHSLVEVIAGDFRSEIAMARPGGGPAGPPGKPDQQKEGVPVPKPAGPPPGEKPGPAQAPSAPILLVLVSDTSRFRGGSPEQKHEWGAIDTGIVSQNISLFCAAIGLATRPRASMNKDKLKTLLKLKDSQYLFLNHPVGYRKK